MTAILPPSTQKWDSRYTCPLTRVPHAKPHTGSYYAKCMVGGILACGVTHTGIVPLDTTKCRMQVFPGKYSGLVSSMRAIVREEGVRALGLGWAPTFVGYSMQGLCKFGFYEYFKDFYSNLLGENIAGNYKGFVWLGASASAEFFADIALCPFEMVKVKMQTSPAGTWPRNFLPATKLMHANRAETQFPMGSIAPLWTRQIPYTMAKFFFFERTVQLFYDHIFTAPKDSYNRSTQLGVTFASGYLAGIICAVISQPADNVVSQMGKIENKGKSFGTILGEVGLKKLMMNGLGARILMVGTLTGFQWWIYDSFKTYMGMGTTGSGSGKK
ncbi:putative phosphate carrier [Cardiosporidium cionae]|uniref:Phosphate carrier n=1 Tax=Cardiosporidium cionae TaxID=476202 RepID=A0ABQ7JG72_9APIC|nr:putative phosphate carrier [Cardiosporidium cionae]|eukprot:KAF8822971.1 putative phosphate carrier [Cardiosporidium cionae]